MVRIETVHTLLAKARANGFELRRWFEVSISPEWPGDEPAVRLIAKEGRIFALVFSHEFARAFWKPGARMHFVIPGSTYSRMNGKGEVVTIHRKPFTRRTIKANVWQYHLRQMAVSEDPLQYLERFLPAEAREPVHNEGSVEILEAG